MTIDSVGKRPLEDLTARARIRDAALRLFAERGIDATSIRDIAAEAGVSAGLIRHHFGSKAALRDACDVYAMDQMRRLQEQLFEEGRLADQTFLVSVHPTAMLLQSYLLRSLMDGSDAASAMFDEVVDIGEQWVTERGIQTTDPRACAAVLAAMKLSVFLIPEQLSRVLGVDIRSPEGHARVLSGMVDVFSSPLLAPDEVAQMRAAMERLLDELTRSRRAG